jgi:hypothetical protein
VLHAKRRAAAARRYLSVGELDFTAPLTGDLDRESLIA